MLLALTRTPAMFGKAHGMDIAMTTTDWTPQGSTAESLTHLGMPPDLQQP
ncbi:hypothetical protein [Candidatus Poriferisocius sp.]